MSVDPKTPISDEEVARAYANWKAGNNRAVTEPYEYINPQDFDAKKDDVAANPYAAAIQQALMSALGGRK